MSTYARIAELPLEIESYALEGLERDVSSDFIRLTTLIRLRGGGHEGVGEDVTYTALDQIGFQDAGREPPARRLLRRRVVLARGGAARACGRPRPRSRRRRSTAGGRSRARRSTSRCVRPGARCRRCSGASRPRSASWCPCGSATRRALEPLRRRLDAYPGLRFKLDATAEWTDELIAELVATGAVDTIDFKGAYKGTSVDQPGDPDLYARVAAAFPDAWLEDPDLNDETAPVLAEHHDRITWDVPDPLGGRHRGAARSRRAWST